MMESVAFDDRARRIKALHVSVTALCLRHGTTYKSEGTLGIPPTLFICLFLAALGVFFLGVGVLWWVSLQARAMQRGANDGGSLRTGSDQIAT